MRLGMMTTVTTLLVATAGMAHGEQENRGLSPITPIAAEDKEMNANPGNCMLLDAPKSSAQSKFVIERSGRYCLAQDLHARFDMADHPAEGAMIIIWANDVVLDLQGHTLGRGRLFRNPGGVGVSIRQGKTNIRILNGTVQDFDRGIFRLSSFPMPTDVEETPEYDSRTNTYRFPVANIIIENVIFKNNKKNILIEVRKDMTP